MATGETVTTASNGRALITCIWMVAGSGSMRDGFELLNVKAAQSGSRSDRYPRWELCRC
jgi:hypothetical protein